MTVAQLVFPIAALSSAALAIAVLARANRGLRDVAMASGFAAFALEALAAYVLVVWTDASADRLLWLRVATTFSVLVFVPWLVFVGDLLMPAGSGRARGRRPLVASLVALATILSALVWVGEPFVVSHLPGRFYAVRLSELGLYLTIAQILGTIAIVAGLEIALRTANREARWRLKYPVLGLGALFLVRFYLLSHVLLFHVALAAYLTTVAAALTFATIVIAVSALRRPLAGATLTISPSVVLRSVVVASLGVYLFVVGGLGWLLDRLGWSEELFWGSLVVFAGAAVAGALMLSESLRWRAKRFIGVHFYHSKYDYRTQWMSFTRRLGSTVTLDELAPQLLTAATEAVGTAKGILYLRVDDGYHVAAALEVHNPPAVLDESSALVRRAREGAAPLPVRDAERPSWFPQAAVLVPLTWQGSLTGVMIIAPERTNVPYTAEDLQFLTAVGVQMAAAIVTTRLSEAAARAREFEAFHRLTSFVAHDLKNAVSSLSMLSENAKEHFDDPEFQRDVVITVSKSVERMRKLLRRLTSAGEVPQVRSDAVDLPSLLSERVLTLVRAPHVTVKTDLQPASIVGDAEALERVFHNLLVNAVEALDGGGEVRVTSTTRGTAVVCEIADTGCGMSPEFMRRSLFVPFRSSKKGGWGIGLYHAREIIRAHGGRIDVKSAEGQGTVFTVKFPAAGGPEREASP